jgi:hypothetical protein
MFGICFCCVFGSSDHLLVLSNPMEDGGMVLNHKEKVKQTNLTLPALKTQLKKVS